MAQIQEAYDIFTSESQYISGSEYEDQNLGRAHAVEIGARSVADDPDDEIRFHFVEFYSRQGTFLGSSARLLWIGQEKNYLPIGHHAETLHTDELSHFPIERLRHIATAMQALLHGQNMLDIDPLRRLFGPQEPGRE